MFTKIARSIDKGKRKSLSHFSTSYVRSFAVSNGKSNLVDKDGITLHYMLNQNQCLYKV